MIGSKGAPKFADPVEFKREFADHPQPLRAK
jgi:hypothetical protein